MRLRSNDPPTDVEYGALESLVTEAVEAYKHESLIPKRVVEALINVEPGLSQGLRFYSEEETERLEDWRDRIVAALEDMFES